MYLRLSQRPSVSKPISAPVISWLNAKIHWTYWSKLGVGKMMMENLKVGVLRLGPILKSSAHSMLMEISWGQQSTR